MIQCETLSDLFDAYGGTTKTASLFDVTPPRVSQIRSDGVAPASWRAGLRHICGEVGCEFREEWIKGRRIAA